MQKLTIYQLVFTAGDYIRTYRTTDPLEILLFSSFVGLLGRSEDIGYTWEPIPLYCVSVDLKPLHDEN